MRCREFREIADSYLGNELIVETNHEVISHLEQCPECRRELAARRELRSQLRQAFLKAPENQLRPEFARQLRIHLHDDATGKPGAAVVSARGRRSLFAVRRTALLALAACLVLATIVGLVAIRVRFSEPAQPSKEIARNTQT
ncbi:MAG TPA: zf-HC2 domain-containing protein, partial [Pyrinomonadaceae bacterium]|nr:zf-HC2 domain-containing protein [Pyrinomonadaceae bacterium]